MPSKNLSVKSPSALFTLNQSRASAAVSIRKLLAWAGSQSELGRVAGVSAVAVNRWIARGAVGEESAYVLSLIPGCPVTFAQMRPDIKNYEADPKAAKAVAAFVKKQTAYIAKRDRSVERKTANV